MNQKETTIELAGSQRIFDIRARLDRLAEFDGELPCTCVQTDVDFFDNRFCESCNNNSEWNLGRRRAEAQINQLAAQDLSFLLSIIDKSRGVLSIKRDKAPSETLRCHCCRAPVPAPAVTSLLAKIQVACRRLKGGL